MKHYFLRFACLILCLCLLCGCSCKHEWTDAACLTAKTCTLCGETEGDPLGHSWVEATCEAPKSCALCGEEEGDALGHEWQKATCEEAESCTRCETVGSAALGHTYAQWECDGESFTHTCQTCGCTETLAPEAYFIQLLTGKHRAKVYSNGSSDTLHPEDYMTIHPDGSVELILNPKLGYPETAQLVKEEFGYLEFPAWEGWRIVFFLENTQWWDEQMGPDVPRELGLFLMVDYSPAPDEGLDIMLSYPGYHDLWIFELSGYDFGEVPD